MDEKYYAKSVRFPENVKMNFDPFEGVFTSLTQKVFCDVVDNLDNCIFETISEEARKSGFTDVIIFDKEFVLTALKNELNRRQK
jgi:hypothetical protein